jgi:hypothetical protein
MSKRKAHWRSLHPNYMKEWYIKHKENAENKQRDI